VISSALPGKPRRPLLASSILRSGTTAVSPEDTAFTVTCSNCLTEVGIGGVADCHLSRSSAPRPDNKGRHLTAGRRLGGSGGTAEPGHTHRVLFCCPGSPPRSGQRFLRVRSPHRGPGREGDLSGSRGRSARAAVRSSEPAPERTASHSGSTPCSQGQEARK
jgi:hypothetical protein